MRILPIYIIFLSIAGLSAQPAVSILRVNQLEGAINANGLLFDSLGNPGLSNRAGLVLANRSGIWMSATDSSGNVIVSSHDMLGNAHEFKAGPLGVRTGQPADPSAWNKTYLISRQEIDYHRKSYQQAGYSAAFNILNWPGSATDPYAKILAPFVDYQVNDQVYEPLKGDYPYITSDALAYSISNDRFGNNESLGMEIHTSMYGFDERDSILKNCILVRYAVHNRSGKAYPDFRLSSVTHFRIGNFQNEFLGTDVRNQLLFAVNDTSEATFSGKLVSMGCMLINRKLFSTIYFNDNADPISGRPVTDQDYYHLMCGRWKSGKQLTYFANGVDGSSPAKYVYPYDTDASHADSMWSEESTLNQSGQRIGIMNTDSSAFRPGEIKVYDFVYFFVDEKLYNIKQIGGFCLKLKNALASKNLLDIDSKDLYKTTKMTCFPNPVSGGEKLMITNVPESAVCLRLISLTGQEICKFDLDINADYVILPPDLPGGMYMVECKTLNTIHYNKLLVNN